MASERSSWRSRLNLFIDPLGRPRFDLGGWLSLLKRWRPGAFLCDLFGAEPRVNLDGFPTPYAVAPPGGTVEDSTSAELGRSGFAASGSGASGFGGSGVIAIAMISSRQCSTNVWRAGSLAPSSAFWKRSNA